MNLRDYNKHYKKYLLILILISSVIADPVRYVINDTVNLNNSFITIECDSVGEIGDKSFSTNILIKHFVNNSLKYKLHKFNQSTLCHVSIDFIESELEDSIVTIRINDICDGTEYVLSSYHIFSQNEWCHLECRIPAYFKSSNDALVFLQKISPVVNEKSKNFKNLAYFIKAFKNKLIKEMVIDGTIKYKTFYDFKFRSDLRSVNYQQIKKFTDAKGSKQYKLTLISKLDTLKNKDGLIKKIVSGNELNLTVKSNGKKLASVWDYTPCKEGGTIELLEDSLRITDLDSNGVAEVTLMYQIRCRNSEKPAQMKLIMLHGDEKYKLRGTKTFLFNHNFNDCKFNIDSSFNKKNYIFLNTAISWWENHLYDSLYEELTPQKEKLLKELKETLVWDKEDFLGID